jgi:hypothetical protein
MYCTRDANKVHREGCLRPGWAGGLQWTCDGEKFAAIDLRADADGHLTYRVRGGGESLAETVRIVRLPCRFGGARPYFICPGVANGVTCGRRVTMLGPKRSGSASAAIPTRPLPSHRSRSAFGDALMNACASKPLRGR